MGKYSDIKGTTHNSFKVGGTPGAGKVLTSDINGVGTWEDNVTGFTNEAAQDAIGAMVDTDASVGHVAFLYTDATPKLSAKVLKPVQSKGSVSGAQTLDLTSYGAITITSGGAITVDLTGTYTSGKLYVAELVITNGGANTWGWAAKFHFVGSTVPTLTANGVDSFTLLTRDGGTTCMVFINGLDIKAD